MEGPDLRLDSWQEIHEKMPAVTAQDPGKAIQRMHAFNNTIRASERLAWKKKQEEKAKKEAQRRRTAEER